MRGKVLHAGRVVRLELAEVRLPDGRVAAVERIRHPGGAAVAAVDEGGRVCLLRQWRPALEAWLWELPAGTLEAGEAPLAAARRELAEEAGLEAARWEPLGEAVMAPGFCDEVIHLYLAQGLRLVPLQRDPHELMEIHWLDLEEAARQALEGGLTDAKTVAGLLRARDRLRRAGA